MAPNPLLDVSRRLVIAHRGDSAHAPENTMAAFQLGHDKGADAFELDVHISIDGVPVVHHDPTLERTTRLTGPVAGRSTGELRAAGVPTLAELLTAFPHMPMIVEIKDVRAQAAVARVLVDLGATERCVVAADDPAAVEAFAAPPFLRGSSRPEITRLFAGSLFGFPPRHVDYRLLAIPDRYRGLPVANRRFFAAARRLGVPVHVWTVNDPVRAAELWAAGACGIITDDPGAMRRRKAEG